MTEYRIIPFVDRYNTTSMCLQFKDNDDWRFVPESIYAKVSGKHLYSAQCPLRIDSYYDIVSSYVGSEDKLKAFVKKHPYIETYLFEIRESRQSFLKKEEEDKKATAIYLNGPDCYENKKETVKSEHKAGNKTNWLRIVSAIFSILSTIPAITIVALDVDTPYMSVHLFNAGIGCAGLFFHVLHYLNNEII